MADIMADNQTEAVLAQLDRGEVDSRTQATILAAVLRALTKMTGQLEDMNKSLWSARDLEDVIDKRHQHLCDRCPLRAERTAEKTPEKASRPNWLLSLLTNSSFQMYMLMGLLVLVVAYLAGGSGAVEALKGAAPVLGGGAIR